MQWIYDLRACANVFFRLLVIVGLALVVGAARTAAVGATGLDGKAVNSTPQELAKGGLR